MTRKERGFLTNLLYAFGAQGISLMLSILMSLIVPKLLGVEEYAYWQLFLLYAGYVGFSHLGLVDGIYLKYGGKKYEELDYSFLSSQYLISFIIQCVISFGIIVSAYISQMDSRRLFVIIGVMAYMLIFNYAGYLGYIFQAVNQTRWYSLSIIIDRIVFIVAVVLAIVLKIRRFEYFIGCYALSKTVALLYCIILGKEIVFSAKQLNKKVCLGLIDNIKIGSNLLIANIASSLILGIGRMIVEKKWGLSAFGQFSFSLSLTNFFLQFISQVSMVLFPSLRRNTNAELKYTYVRIRAVISLLIPLVFIVYPIIKLLVSWWLPDYATSLVYMAYLLPLCTFDGKMQLLCNTYLKVLRKEKMLLFVNIFSAFTSLLLGLMSAYLFDSVFAVVISMVVAIAIRSLISEIYLSRLMEVNNISSFTKEIVLVISFLLLVAGKEGILGYLLFVLCYVIFIVLSRDNVKILSDDVKNILKRKVKNHK